MEVYRLTRERYGLTLSGKGAAMKGARWNSAGTEFVYTASNRSLAMAEVAVHFSLASLPDDYHMLTIYIPDGLKIVKLAQEELPENWNAFPHSSSTQKFGDQFALKNKSCVLQVPSAVTFGDYNLLLNPFHSDFAKIKIIDHVKFPFDKRIFKG
ncbi:MAG: RES family NAD+ phosphorylase [Bacteroidia bacterium]|jgi:RES domain-containing protein|nr:RES family NAD+ phosphorylase [Bacteroidia bacterium]